MNQKSKTLLLAIAVAMVAVPDKPFGFASVKDAAQLVKEGFAEQNAETVESEGSDKIATRLTEKGLALAAELKAAQGNSEGNSKTEAKADASFEIEDGIPVPAARGGRGKSRYPFETLGVNQSFHVAATTERPKPAKSLASTVSSAAKRKADGRKYTVREVGAEDPKGAGARVWRTA